MRDPTRGNPEQPFPAQRPEVRIEAGPGKLPPVDYRELRGWFVIPVPGEHAVWSIYDADPGTGGWALSSVCDVVATMPARVHEVDCVEISQRDWTARGGWDARTRLIYAALEDEEVRWVATADIRKGVRIVSTFLDDGFVANWGEGDKRLLVDGGRYAEEGVGVFRTTDAAGLGAGSFDVVIGEREFCCLRVLDPGEGLSEEGMLVEAFVTEEGRTVLFRRYNGRLWKYGGVPRPEVSDWRERLPGHATITIDDIVYVHWYDCLTGASLGLES